MAATSLKLPEDLKRRIERLANAANKTPHAFMVEALAREAERSESGRRLRQGAVAYFFIFLGSRLADHRLHGWRGNTRL
jgi:hypothetical protein